MTLRLTCLLVSIFCLAASSASAQPDDDSGQKGAAIVKLDSSALPTNARARLGKLAGYRYAGSFSAAAMSLDGKLIAVAAANGDSIKIIDVATGKTAQNLQTKLFGGIRSGMAFSADGSTLAVQSFQDVRVWDIATGKQLQQVQNRDNFGRAQGPSLSRDGKMVGLSGDQLGQKQTGEVKALDVATGKVIGPFEAMHNYNIRTAMAPDGKTMVSFGQHLNRAGAGGFDRESPRTLQVWDLAAGKELRQIKLDFGPQGFGQIANAAYAPDSKTLAVVSGGSTFHLIDLATGKETRRFAGQRNSSGVGSLCFSPDGEILAASGFSGALQGWEIKTGKRLDLDEGPKAQLLAIAFPGKNRIVAMGNLAQSLHWWDANLGDKASAFEGHLTPVAAIAFAGDAKSIVTAGSDQTIIWWDLAAAKETRRLTLPDDDARFGGGRASSMAISPNARYAATMGQLGIGGIRLWNLKTSRVVLDFDGPRSTSYDTGMAFSPDGGKLAAADGPTPLLWDIGTGQSLLKLPAGNARNAFNPARIAFSPDGKMVAVHASQFDMMGRQNAELVVWDIAQAKELHRSNRAMPNINAVNASGSLAYSRDSRFLAVTEVNGAIALLHAGNGREAKRITSASRNSSFQLAFSPDLRFLAVGMSPFNPGGLRNVPADEPIIEIWELAGGQLRDRFVGHTGAITSLAFSPDGATLASGSMDTTVLLWDFTFKSGPKLQPVPQGELAAAWQALAGKDAKIADTLRRLVQTPGAVAFLKQNFQPAKAADIDEKMLAKLVADLDSGNFKARELAMRDLKAMGERAEAALKKGLASGASVEAHRRMQDLLDLMVRSDVTPEELQAIRGVEVLERIGNADARELLGALTKGDPAARVTQEAAQALKRMAPR